jgi:hypothetical protein
MLPLVAITKRRDLIGGAFLILGVVVSLAIESGWKSRAAFLAFGVVCALIAYGSKPTVSTSKMRLGIGLAIFALGATVAVVAEPGLFSVAATVAISTLAAFIAHGGHRRDMEEGPSDGPLLV